MVGEMKGEDGKVRAVGALRRQILGKRRLERDAIEPSGEYFYGLMDDGVGIGGYELRGREAHELRKLVDQCGERGDFPLDQARTFLDQFGQLRITRRRRLRDGAPLPEYHQPLCRKL